MENEKEFDRSTIDLDAPASFDDATEDDPMLPGREEKQAELRIEKKVSVSPDEDTVIEKSRIPYSRFEKVNERAIQAETRLQMLEEQLAQSNQKSETGQEVNMPSEWRQILGDTDEGKAAYDLLMKMNEKSRSEETNRILEELDKRQQAKNEEINNNLDYIENNLAEFQESLNRKLTEAEESAILDIQDEFTPEDKNGNYIAPLLSAEKAFEIYTLRQAAARGEKSQARRKVVSLTGASSDGEGSGSDWDSYNPMAWGQWEKKL
jgi:hypothetical protein